MNLVERKKITIVTTGGTIEKTYDERDGSLANKDSVIKELITSRLRLPHTELEVFALLSKDSLNMTDEDRELIYLFLKSKTDQGPIIVLHGTDTMTVTAEFCLNRFDQIDVPIIFTGAMKPFGFLDSDAIQNITESLMAAKLAPPGVYLQFHNNLFEVPNVKKNKFLRTFEEI